MILIGPEEYASRHCEPEPAYLETDQDWRMAYKLRISGDDVIAVYVRRGAFT